jgi:hypothetical protein
LNNIVQHNIILFKLVSDIVIGGGFAGEEEDFFSQMRKAMVYGCELIVRTHHGEEIDVI